MDACHPWLGTWEKASIRYRHVWSGLLISNPCFFLLPTLSLLLPSCLSILPISLPILDYSTCKPAYKVGSCPTSCLSASSNIWSGRRRHPQHAPSSLRWMPEVHGAWRTSRIGTSQQWRRAEVLFCFPDFLVHLGWSNLPSNNLLWTWTRFFQLTCLVSQWGKV